MTKSQLALAGDAQTRAEVLYDEITRAEAQVSEIMERVKVMRNELTDIIREHGEARGKSIFLQTATDHESRLTRMDRTSLADEPGAVKYALKHHPDAVVQRIDAAVWRVLKLPPNVRAKFEKTSSGEVLYV